MKISESLQVESIQIGLDTGTRDGAIAQLVSLLGKSNTFAPEPVLKELLARERARSTFLTGCLGLAMPHAAIESCKQLAIAVGTSKQGISWGPEKSARIVLLVVGPPQTQALALKVISRFIRICNTGHFFEALLSAASPKQFLALVAEAENGLGQIPPCDNMPRFCVLGAGNGGMAMAAHLALSGSKVSFFNRTSDRIEAVKARGGIDVTGEVSGFAALNLVTDDPAVALEAADVLMIVVPATAHSSMAEIIAPHLRDGQIVVLNPGRTGGALEIARVIRQINPSVRPYIAEAQTLLYASRVTNPGQVRIFGIKNSVPIATLPGYQIADVLPVIRKALPQFVPADNVLLTSLDNIGAVFHPAITVLNAARIEDTHGDFQYYVEGVTPSVAQVLEAVDRERVAVANALGVRAHAAREWLYLAYDAPGKTLLDAMRANPGYLGIKAPGTVDTRYISEDVPTSLVPIASLGEMLNVPTPATRAIILLASLMHKVDYWAEGRTVERLGIQGMSVKELHFFVTGAEMPAVNRAEAALWNGAALLD